MRWIWDARFRAAARRRAGIAFLILAFGGIVFLDWAGTAPQPVLPPEAGGQVSGIGTVADVPVGNGGAGAAATAAPTELLGEPVRAAAMPRQWGNDASTRPPAVQTETNPLDLLVDGPGFIGFLGFTAIALGVAVVVLVFFWSHRRNLRS